LGGCLRLEPISIVGCSTGSISEHCELASRATLAASMTPRMAKSSPSSMPNRISPPEVLANADRVS
jgi:hypothetical protein